MEDEGYYFNFQAGKFTTSTGQPPDLSLIYVCRQIAEEMGGIALRSNTLVFKTAYDNQERANIAGRYSALLDALINVKVGLLNEVRSLITPEIVDRVASKFPQFVPVLHNLRDEGTLPNPKRFFRLWTSSSWGMAPSLDCDFVSYALQLASEHPDFARTIALSPFWGDAKMPATPDILALQPVPWAIPTSAELDTLAAIVSPILYRWQGREDWWDRVMHRFSAASVAIDYLNSMPTTKRSHLRSIILDEDSESVMRPQCHTRGLIPFCIENPHLRIERRASLWRTIFPGGNLNRPKRILYNIRNSSVHSLKRSRLSNSLAPWLLEALALRSLGMPEDCFMLTIDGDLSHDKTIEAFEMITIDAIWQSALDESYRRNYLPAPTWVARRNHPCYALEGFLEVMQDIVNGNSLIRCNFCPAQLQDREILVQQHREWGWSYFDWMDEHRALLPRTITPGPPLPAWINIALAQVIPGPIPEWY